MLFPPDDTVYMEDDAERKEYVTSDFGRVYVGGSRNYPNGVFWAFGQFDNPSLDASLYVLDNSRLPWAAYGNPVRVTRTLSAMVRYIRF